MSEDEKQQPAPATLAEAVEQTKKRGMTLRGSKAFTRNCRPQAAKPTAQPNPEGDK